MKRRGSPPLHPFSHAALPPGTRLGLAVSGGSDSVAMLRIAAGLASREGWTLRVLHVDHGLRGEASTADAGWVQALAEALQLPCFVLPGGLSGAQAGLEEAGRRFRYGWFARLLLARELDVIATGHTLDDQAETVLAKLLRGAWTAGLGGIAPVLAATDLPGASGAGPGVVVRPLLDARRSELRAWLEAIGQGWREDETNWNPEFTRNRIRHSLLPALAEFNPRITEQLAQTSTLAREDEAFWQAEVQRLLPDLLLPGRAVRGGGRAASTLPGLQSIAMEVDRLRALAPALRRRVLRAAAAQLGAQLDYDETARVFALLEVPVSGTPRREQLTAQLRAERTPRELRLISEPATAAPEPDVAVPVPGEAAGFGVRVRVATASGQAEPAAMLRAARPSDRIQLRYSNGAPKRIKEVFDRLGIPPPDRTGWPVLTWQGEIVWMQGAVLEPTPLSCQLAITVLDQSTESPLPATP